MDAKRLARLIVAFSHHHPPQRASLFARRRQIPGTARGYPSLTGHRSTDDARERFQY